jgi:hypothetical protein
MWRKLESLVAAGSFILLFLVSYWIYYSDDRLDHLQSGNVQVYANSGKLIVLAGGPAEQPVTWRDPKSWGSHWSMPYSSTAKVPPANLPALDWHSFTYRQDSDGVRSVVLPAWLILIALTLLPGLWILRIGRPATKRRRRREKKEQPAGKAAHAGV